MCLADYNIKLSIKKLDTIVHFKMKYTTRLCMEHLVILLF